MLKFKQIIVKQHDGKLAAVATDGSVYAQVRQFSQPQQPLQWQKVDTGEVPLPVVHLAANGDPLVVVDRNGAVWHQQGDGRMGSTYTWQPVDMTVAEASAS